MFLLLVSPLPTRIHSIILTLRKPIFRTPVVGQHSTENRGRVIGRDAADDDSVSSWGLVVGIGARFEYWKFEVRLLRVREGELFVVWKSKYG
jgi:hypothetical protein